MKLHIRLYDGREFKTLYSAKKMSINLIYKQNEKRI